MIVLRSLHLLLRRMLVAKPSALSILPRGLHTDVGAFISQLRLCAAARHLPRARQIHARLVVAGLHASPVAASALTSLYSKLAIPADALAAFLSCHAPNLFAWNAAIAALASNGRPADALRLFYRLRFESGLLPDEFTYPSVLRACSDLGSAGEAGKIHASLFKAGYEAEMFTASALVHCYLRFGCLSDAEKVFDELPQKDVVLWNAMVIGFAQLGRFSRSLDYFHRMIVEGLIPSRYTITGILSVFTARADLNSGAKVHSFLIKMGYDDEIAVCNSLIDLYGKCHAVDEAGKVFDTMPERDVFSWNSMICAYQYSADHARTQRLFCQMRHAGVVPDAVTAAAVLPACSQTGALKLGREIHGYVITSGMMVDKDVFVDNALMDMYAKCGALEEARLIFDRISHRDVASWNVVIDGHGSHGKGREAVELFKQMVDSGVEPDEVTFVGVLSACSHAGLVATGRELLDRMEADFMVVPGAEHHSCVADMLGRAGLLEDARNVAEAAGQLGAGAWKAYLAACRKHKDTERALEAVDKAAAMEPQGSGSYVLLASTYGGAGRYSELAEVRRQMRQRGVSKAPGCSWVEVGGLGMHAFVAGDHEHPETEHIYAMLHSLNGEMKEECDSLEEEVMGIICSSTTKNLNLKLLQVTYTKKDSYS